MTELSAGGNVSGPVTDLGIVFANLAAGDLPGAEAAFIEGLTTSEQTGLVREMLSLILKIAGIRHATGEQREAVELFAAILAEPMSAQVALFDIKPLDETAADSLAEIQEMMDPDEYAAAYAIATLRSYDVAAKELIDSLADSRQDAER